MPLTPTMRAPANRRVGQMLIMAMVAPIRVGATSIKMDFLPLADVRTDPVINPDCLADHVHTFYGANASLHPSTSYEDLRAAQGNSGNVEENKSLYWHPTVYMFDRITGLFTKAPIWFASAYYVWKTGEVAAFPNGFKMIATAMDRLSNTDFECVGPSACRRDNCEVGNSVFPATACAELEVSMVFPNCWDGVSLDSADHMSHVAYAEDGAWDGDCPSSHPVQIPQIHFYWRILNYEGGHHEFSDGSSNFHADYFSGWNESELQNTLDRCRNDGEAAMPDQWCEDHLTFRDAPKRTGDTSIIERLHALQPTPRLATRATITDERITDVATLPRGACTGSLIPAASTPPTPPTAPPTTAPPTEPAQYLLREVGNCNGLAHIADLGGCEEAARLLGLVDATASTTTSDTVPYGCYFKDSNQRNKLYWAAEGDRDSSSRSRVSICITGSTPPPPNPPTSSACTENGFPRCVSGGGSINEVFGPVIIVGDSLLDGDGDTDGMVESTVSSVLSTAVINNAIGGFSLTEIYDDLPACSADVQCRWSVVSGGMNENEENGRTMEDLVSRELAANKHVIILGYGMDAEGPAHGPRYEAFMDSYAAIASSTDNVWFIDPRRDDRFNNPSDPATRQYRAGDDSHPSPLAGAIFGGWIANLIRAGPDSGPWVPEMTPPPSVPTPPAPTPPAPEPTIVLREVGNCNADGDFEHLDTSADCEEAAGILGLGDTTVRSISSENRPHGCYVKADNARDRQLFFNTDGDLESDDARRVSICSEAQPPAPTPPGPAPADWLLREVGNCGASGYVAIDGREGCDLAAAALGLATVTARVINRDYRPVGCYYKADNRVERRLFFNEGEGDGGSVDTRRVSLCKSVSLLAEAATLPLRAVRAAPTSEIAASSFDTRADSDTLDLASFPTGGDANDRDSATVASAVVGVGILLAVMSMAAIGVVFQRRHTRAGKRDELAIKVTATDPEPVSISIDRLHLSVVGEEAFVLQAGTAPV